MLNKENEKIAFEHLKNIYGYIPKSATARDVVRMISYSAAVK